MAPVKAKNGSVEIRNRIVGLQNVKASDLVPHPMNFRRHPENQRSALAASLESLGLADRILAYPKDDKLCVIDGHLRREMAGDAEVPVLVVDLTDAEARLLIQVADPMAALAEQDDGMLTSLRALTEQDRLDGLIAPGPGLDALLGRNGGGGLLPGADPDAIPAEVETRCKPGHLWGLGEHRLVVSDCTDAAAVKRLMEGERAKLLLTDPPYAVDYVEKARDMNQRGYGHSRAKSSAAIEGDGIEAGQEEGLWRGALEVAYSEAVAESAAVYLWHDPRRAGTRLHLVLEQFGMLHHQTLVWLKPGFVIARTDYQGAHEPCWYGWKQGHRPPFYGERNQTTVWQAARDAAKPLHPTQKPVVLFEPPIQNHLRPGEIVYDPFAGSGTAIVAAEKCGRRCFACEVSPRHADTCLARYESLTGREAVLLEPGRAVETMRLNECQGSRGTQSSGV